MSQSYKNLFKRWRKIHNRKKLKKLDNENSRCKLNRRKSSDLKRLKKRIKSESKRKICCINNNKKKRKKKLHFSRMQNKLFYLIP